MDCIKQVANNFFSLIFLTLFLLSASNLSAQSSLLGSEISIETILQNTSVSEPQGISVETIASVSEPVIEFPSMRDLQGPEIGLVDVAINAGADFLEIDFDNVNAPQFGDAFFNGYVITLADDIAFKFVAATVDVSSTTLGLTDDDVVLSGNKLNINVQGLLINPSNFIRINLTSYDVLSLLDTIDSLGNATTAKIRGGISVDDGLVYASTATVRPNDKVLIDFVIEPDPQHIGLAASILVAVRDRATGVTNLLAADGLFYAVDLANLVSFDQVILKAGHLVQILTGSGLTVGLDLVGTDGELFIGYLVGGEIYYNEEPVQILVE